jgi:hypothetical protein
MLSLSWLFIYTIFVVMKRWNDSAIPVSRIKEISASLVFLFSWHEIFVVFNVEYCLDNVWTVFNGLPINYLFVHEKFICTFIQFEYGFLCRDDWKEKRKKRRKLYLFVIIFWQWLFTCLVKICLSISLARL